MRRSPSPSNARGAPASASAPGPARVPPSGYLATCRRLGPPQFPRPACVDGRVASMASLRPPRRDARNRKRNHPRPRLMDTSRVDGVKAPQHHGTPRSCMAMKFLVCLLKAEVSDAMKVLPGASPMFMGLPLQATTTLSGSFTESTATPHVPSHFCRLRDTASRSSISGWASSSLPIN